MISIGTDISALILQNTLENSTIGLNNSLERISTGYKINHAKDDAAGFFVAENLSTKISSMIMVQQNVDDGIALLQTAEGALDNIMSLLQRLRDLAEQSANEVYGEDSRKALQAEADQIVEQIEQIKNTTEFNGLNLFDGRKNEKTTTTTNNNTAQRIGISNASVKINDTPIYNGNNESEVNTVSFNDALKSIDEEISQLTKSMSYNAMPAMAKAPAANQPVPAANTIDGTEEFTSKESRDIVIDGVTYTITNKSTANNTFTYSKDQDTGVLTFDSSNFEITAQSDVSHNIIISGGSITYNGGNLGDSISVTGESNNIINAGTGNDTITSSVGGTLNGGDGDDTFNITGKTATINGGSGNNTINMDGVDGSFAFAANATQVIRIDNVEYLVTNKNNSTATFTYKKATDGKITFSSSNFEITGQTDVSHNIGITGSNVTYNGGNIGDSISITGGSNNVINGGDGNDSITTSVSATINGNNGDDVIRATGGTSTISGGNGNDSITLESSGKGTVNGDDGDDTITVKSSDNKNIHGGIGNDSFIISGSRNYIYGDEGQNSFSLTAGTSNYLYGGDDVDNFDLTGGSSNRVFGAGGDDIFNVGKSSSNLLFGEDGEDTFNFETTATSNSVDAGAGTNSATGDLSDNYIFNVAGKSNEGAFLKANETQTVTINGIQYTVKNNKSDYNVLVAQTDGSGITKLFNADNLDITMVDRNSGQNKLNIVSNNTNFYGGNLGDSISVTGTFNKVVTYDGKDTITITKGAANNVNNEIFSGKGDDLLFIGGYSNSVYGEDGNDTLHVTETARENYGQFVDGGSGDNAFIVDAGVNNAFLVGGGGNNTIEDHGRNTILSGFGDISNAYDFNLKAGESRTIVLNGLEYKITNNDNIERNVQGYYQADTGEVVFTAKNTTIEAQKDKAHNVRIYGDGIKFYGGDLNDTISDYSSYGEIHGGEGNDIITLNGRFGKALGENGDDVITLTNGGYSGADAGAGNDTLYIDSDFNTGITAGTGDDSIIVNGDSNSFNCGDGNDKVSIKGDSNTVNSGTGNNIIDATGDKNNITTGNGDNNISINGDKNTVTGGTGDDTIDVNGGTSNTIKGGEGDNTINIKSDSNTVTTGNGDNEINISGGSNNKVTTGNGSDSISISGGGSNNINSGKGDNSIEIGSSDNTITTGDGNDEFIVKGDNNDITTSGGNNNTIIQGDENEFTANGNGDNEIKITGDKNTATGGNGDDKFTVTDGDRNHVNGGGGNNNTLVDGGTNTIAENVIDNSPKPFEITLKVDIGSSKDNYITSTIDLRIIDFSVDISSVESSLESLDRIDKLMEKVTQQLTNIGATINRLESVRDAQTIKMNNLIASRSTIKDVDMANESSNFIRYQILQNASSSLYSVSRNLREDMVLGILGSINVGQQ